MPFVASSAYVSVETITLLIRALANDMIYSQAGEIITDDAPFLFPLLNDSLEWFQNEITNHGVSTFERETVLANVTPIATADPGVQVNISDTGYFDGVLNAAFPQVPPDLYVPIRLWERQSGTQDNWCPMTEYPNGLPSVQQGDRLGIWEWREDALNMPGATQTNDIRLRYTGVQGPFVTVNDILYFRGATGPIAYKMLSSYLASKNPDASKLAAAEAEQRLSQIATRSSRMKQRQYNSRRSYGSLGNGGRFFRPPSN